MDKQKRKPSLILKVLVGIVFLSVFVLNITTLVRKDTKTDKLFLTTLQANAEESGEGGTPGGGGGGTPQGRKCGKDGCEVHYSVGIYSVVEYGSYYHCQTSMEKVTCESSSCDVRCDAL